MSEPMPVPDVGATPVALRRTADPRELARDRLGAALRSLLDTAVRTAATIDEIDAAREQIEHVEALLSRAEPARTPQDNPFHPLSLVGGTAHPAGPQLYLEPIADGVRGTVTLGPALEGGPGLAHGGILALMFDHSMGAAVFLAGYAAMTRTLEIGYHAPTPLEAELTVQARVDRVEGRRVHVAAEIAHRGSVTATAQGVFVALTEENVAAIFTRA